MYQLTSIDSLVETIFSACLELSLKYLPAPIIIDNSFYSIIYKLPGPLEVGSGFLTKDLP